MDSLRFSAATEIYESKRCKLLGNFDPHFTNCVGYHLWASHAVSMKRIVRGDAPRSFSVYVHDRKEQSFKLSCGRLSRTVVQGLEGTSGSYSVTELVEKLEMNTDYDGDVVSVKAQNKANEGNVRKKSQRRIWTRVAAMSKQVQTGGRRQVSTRNGQTLEPVENDIEVKNFVYFVTPESSVERCNSVLNRLEKSNDDRMIEFFRWMKINRKLEKNATAYILALRASARREDWCTAESLIKEMASESGCELTSNVYNALIFICAKRGLVTRGTKWFRMMLESGVEPNVATFGMLMGLYQKNGNLSEAEFTFASMRSFGVQCTTAYSSMITIYTRLGFYGKAEEVIRLMEEDEVVPDSENWLVRLNAYSQQGKLDEAELVLKSMLASGDSPNIVAYNTLITGYGKVSNTKAAEDLFRSLHSIGLEPDETTYRSMVEGFGRADNYEEASRYYKELKDSGFKPSSSNLYTMINLQARHRDAISAVGTLEDMRGAGCPYSSIVTSLVQAYERVGRIHEVPLILKDSFYGNILRDPTSCSILVMAYVQNSLLDEAIRVLREKTWTDSDFEGNLYHLLICSCKESGHLENAIKIYAQMPKSEKTPNLHITCSMIDIYSSMNRFADAENLYLMLRASGVTFDMVAYSIVVRMYIKSGSLEDACSVLEAMEKQKDVVPDVYLFRDMLRTYQQLDMLEKLADVYYQLLRSGITWDEVMYNCVINCCGRALPVDELSKLFDEMIQCGYNANTITFNVMLDVYGKAGFLRKARKVLGMARKRGLADVISYNTIIAAYGRCKDFKTMESIVKQMQHEGYAVSIEAYNCMLHAYGKEGLLEEFNDVLKKMKEARCDSDHYTYNIMINIYAKRGWIEEVARVLEELKGRGLEPDLYSYNTLIKAYGVAGMVEEAVNVVRDMRAKGFKPDRITFTNLIAALQRNESFLEAVKWSLWMKQMQMSS